MQRGNGIVRFDGDDIFERDAIQMDLCGDKHEGVLFGNLGDVDGRDRRLRLDFRSTGR
jgi:hypothetical protein